MHEQPDGSESGSGAGVEREGRKQPRTAWHHTVKIEIEERNDGNSRTREIVVETQDVSASGFGFLAPGFFHVGTRVLVHLRRNVQPNQLVGTVVYCTYEGSGLHRVGVRFDESQPPPPDKKPAASPRARRGG